MKGTQKFFSILAVLALLAAMAACEKPKSESSANGAEGNSKNEVVEAAAGKSAADAEAVQAAEVPEYEEPAENPAWLYFPHEQKLKFLYGGYDTKVFAAPDDETVVYTVQTRDEILVSKVVEVPEAEKSFIQVKIPSGEYGFIEIRRNPYRDGQFSPLETLDVNGKAVKVLKMDTSFPFYQAFKLKALPAKDAETAVAVEPGAGERFVADAITADYSWVRLEAGGQSGWIPAKELSVDRGGPTIFTPEVDIEWGLIDSNEV